MKYRFLAGILSAAAVCAAHAQSTDVLTWFQSQLAANRFIAVDAEYRSGTSWVSHGVGYQPFRTTVNAAGNQAYWRKDSQDLANTWYGEIFNYDANYIYLHSETFPPAMFPGDSWDERIQRFRLFRNASTPSVGRVIAPRTVTPGWSYSQTLNTYMCGVNQITSGYTKVDGFLQVNAGTCPLFQSGVQDVGVTVAIVNNFNVLADGPVASNAPTSPIAGSTDVGALPQVFDSALVISQVMAAGSGYARERFIFGYHQGVYYGIVAWDNATGPTTSSFTVTDRTIGLRVMARTSGNMDVTRFVERGQRDRTLPPPGVPSGLSATCIANSNQMLVRWTGVGGATGSDVRVDDQSDAWNPGGAGGDFFVNNFPGNSYIFPTTAGRQYNWWVHGSNGAGATSPTGASVLASACTGSNPTVPGQPQGVSVSMAGDIATLSWNHAAGATGYDVRVNDLNDGGWAPGTGNDVSIDNHKASSYIVKVVPGRTYDWWVHARNSAGVSNATGGPAVSYPAP